MAINWFVFFLSFAQFAADLCPSRRIGDTGVKSAGNNFEIDTIFFWGKPIHESVDTEASESMSSLCFFPKLGDSLGNAFLIRNDRH